MSTTKPFAALRRKIALGTIPLVRQTALRLGRLGTALPGEVALKIYPPLLADLCEGRPVTLVTGTNGKSSVSALLANMLREAGLTIIHNEGGANMASGLVTAMGCQTKDLDLAKLVFEIDEAWFAKLAPEIKPDYLVVTNLFRDQVDRNGDILAVRDKIARGIRLAQEANPQFKLILNADDPYVASLARELKDQSAVLYFGLAWPAEANKEVGALNYPCPCCGADLDYTQQAYDHVGVYSCPSCDFCHPWADLSISRSRQAGSYHLQYQELSKELNLGDRQDYMLYNLAASALAALVQGADLTSLVKAAEHQQALDGRDQILDLDQERQAQIRLVKNPVGLSLGLEALAADPKVTGLCLMVNNQESDGVDTSWLQEVNYHPLLACQDRLNFVLLSGSRAQDLSAILIKRGLHPDLIRVQSQVGEAWDIAQDLLPPGHKLLVLPNYTTMWELQAILQNSSK